MVQGIAPHTYDLVLRGGKPEDRDYLLHYEYNKATLVRSERGSVIPTFEELGAEGDFSAQVEYLFPINDRAYYCVTDMKVLEFGGFYMEPLTVFRSLEPLYQAFAGVTGSQLYRWTQSRRFYGGYGAKTEPSLKEHALVCPSYGQAGYPKVSPAVIMTITNGGKLLMSRYAKGAYRNYALIAGSVEIGETFEDYVRREVMGEMGLRVENIRYYRGQPWVFSDTEMVGFTAELDGDGTMCLEEEELHEAGWFTRDEVVEYGPYISVGHEMMKAFKNGEM